MLNMALHKSLRLFVRALGVLLACLVALEIYLFCFFTFRRVEWTFNGEGGGNCHVVKEDGDIGVLYFRLDDYSSTNGVYTFRASLRNVELENVLSATAFIEKKRGDSYPICQAKITLDKKQSGRGVDFSARIPIEFAPEEAEETLTIEVFFSVVDACVEVLKTFRMDFKPDLVRHFKSV